MKILNIYKKHIPLIIIPLVLTLSSAQEEDPLGLSANTALQKINSQYGQYFADKIVEMRGLRGQSQPREWTVVVNDERSQLRLRTVRVSGMCYERGFECVDLLPFNVLRTRARIIAKAGWKTNHRPKAAEKKTINGKLSLPLAQAAWSAQTRPVPPSARSR